MIKRALSGIIFFLSITNLAVAQTKDETAIGEAVEKLRKAMVDGNRADLESIVMDKLSYGHSSGLVEDKKEFIEKLVSGRSDFVSIELSNQTISISGKVAIVRHKLDAKTNDGGRPGEAHIQILLIFQKDKKQWKLLARQAVRIVS